MWKDHQWPSCSQAALRKRWQKYNKKLTVASIWKDGRECQSWRLVHTRHSFFLWSICVHWITDHSPVKQFATTKCSLIHNLISENSCNCADDKGSRVYLVGFSMLPVSIARKSLVRKIKWALTYLTQQIGKIPVAISWNSQWKQLVHIYKEKQMPVGLPILCHSQLLYFVITLCPYGNL